MAQTRVKHRGNKYVLQVQDANGKFKQVFSSEKKSEVTRKRRKVQAESVDLKAAIDKRTFVEVYEEFYKYKISVAEREKSAIRYSSIKHYKGWFINYIKPLFDNRILISEVTKKTAKDFFLKLREIDGVTWKMANGIVKSFLTVLKYAVDQQYIMDYHKSLHEMKLQDDPETASSNPKEMLKKKTKMISLQQAGKLFHHLKPRGKEVRAWQQFAVVSTLMFAGVRLSELRGLKWDAITFPKSGTDGGQIEIFRTVVGSGGALEQVKQMGSLRTILVHPVLMEILSEYKSLLNKHYSSIARNYVFPSLRFTDGSNTIPLSGRTITDWIKIAFADLGYAKIKIHKQKCGIKRAFVQLLECEFDNNVTRTFRHFYCTAIKNSQRKNPQALTDNFAKSQSGHRDYKTFSKIYADHDNFDTSNEMKHLQSEAIKDAIPIGYNKN